MPGQPLFYKHSGRFRVVDVAWSFTGILAIGLTLGFSYGVMSRVLEWRVFDVIVLVGLSMAIGFIATQFVLIAKLRNKPLIALAPILGGLAAFYATWVGLLFAEQQWANLSFNPADLSAVAQARADLELLPIFEITPNRYELYVIWVIELSIFIGLAVLAGAPKPWNLPFSETVYAWSDRAKTLPAARGLPANTMEVIREQMKQGDLSGFSLFEPLDDDNADEQTAFTVRWVDGYTEQQFLTITSVTAVYKASGGISIKKKSIAKNMLIDAEALAVIEGMLGVDAMGSDEATTEYPS